MKKLVRDKIPRIILDSGKKPNIRKLEHDEYIRYLRLKLVEEANEVLDAGSHKELIEEMADVQEVLDCLIAAKAMTKQELATIQANKNESRGSFKDKILLVTDE